RPPERYAAHRQSVPFRRDGPSEAVSPGGGRRPVPEARHTYGTGRRPIDPPPCQPATWSHPGRRRKVGTPVTGARILVVDDNEQVRDFMAETVLRPEGYTVDVAEKGLEGLATALTNGPDLIVTDLALPDLDGLKMVQQLRERGCF